MKILCTLPNASNEIDGIPFEQHELGVVGDAPEELAASMLTIPGYQLLDGEPEPKRRGRKPKAADEQESEPEASADQYPTLQESTPVA